jgi:peptidoglycan/xylan/chitin deacetylase (PgdA/CDA1 family)
MLLNRVFYTLKPVIRRRLQIFLRRQIAPYKRKKYAHIWPIDLSAGKPPIGWKGWPEGKKFALVLSHDVDTQKGHDNVLKLAEIDEEMGFRSSFNFVPERYNNSNSLMRDLKSRGFEIGIHGLKHDGKLFRSRKIFNQRAVRINSYIKKWNITGFTSPAMHHNLEWMHNLNIKHSISTFDTDPFEPQPEGVRTIFPLIVRSDFNHRVFVELPYTVPQDHTVFIILKETDTSIWEKKIDWIAKKGGMALLNSHSDYMNFDGSNLGLEEYPAEYYKKFLNYIKTKYKDHYWAGLPSEIARF